MNKPALSTTIAAVAAVVSIIYCTAFYAPSPATTFILECEDLEWVTDTCVESDYYAEYSS